MLSDIPGHILYMPLLNIFNIYWYGITHFCVKNEGLSINFHLFKAWLKGVLYTPLILSITDIRDSAGRQTNTTEVVNMLESAGIKLVISSVAILDKLSQVLMTPLN